MSSKSDRKKQLEIIMAKFLQQVQIYSENDNLLFFSKLEEEEQLNTVCFYIFAALFIKACRCRQIGSIASV